jgi:serine/threonine protein kinase
MVSGDGLVVSRPTTDGGQDGKDVKVTLGRAFGSEAAESNPENNSEILSDYTMFGGDILIPSRRGQHRTPPASELVPSHSKRMLGNRYELGAVLGRGGMAEVFMARDTRLGRTVAVKTLRADLSRDPTFQARFRREAQSAASLNHPAIVAIYDTGEDFENGVSVPYIVMEYADGSTLHDLLHSGRRLLPERALEITAGVLQALDYSHRNGIIHRDIKPANLMLTRYGTMKVMDFGIARAMADDGLAMTQTGAVIGTPQYLSPEQAKGEAVDLRSDLYSTGCLMYELLTGRPPFVSYSSAALAYQHVREEPQPPSSYDPEVSPAIDAVVLKSLAKSADQRYQSATEMRADIERLLDGRPTEASSTLRWSRGESSMLITDVSELDRGLESPPKTRRRASPSPRQRLWPRR